jgi:N-sulfoglucosamine sulfohydrolase
MFPIIKQILKIFALVCLVSACKDNSYDPGLMRPNILFIITDDQSWEHLGSYGDEAVRTPAFLN